MWQNSTMWRPGDCQSGGCGHRGQGQRLCQEVDTLQRDRCSAGAWRVCEGLDAVFSKDVVLGDGYRAGGRMRCWGTYAVLGMDTVLGTVALPDHAGVQLESESALAQLCKHMQSHYTGMLSFLQTPHLHPMFRLEKLP